MRCSRLRRGVVASGDEVRVDLGVDGGGVVVGGVVVEVVGAVVASAEVVVVVGVVFDVVGGSWVVVAVVALVSSCGVTVVVGVGEGVDHRRLLTCLLLWAVGVRADAIAALDATGEW